MMPDRPRVLWITNLAAPYRTALWEAIGRETDLRVVTLAETEAMREKWHVEVPEHYTMVDSPAYQIKRANRETALYVFPTTGRLFRPWRPDAVLIGGWESPAYVQALISAKRRHIPVLMHYGTTPATHSFTTGPLAWARRFILERADRIVTYGTATDRELIQWGLDPDRIVSGFNAVDSCGLAAIGRRFGKEGHGGTAGHRYLSVGRLLPRKNVAALIDAFSTVAASGDELTVAGSGPLHDELVRQATGARVNLTGHLAGDDLHRAYATHDTVVLPSTEEVWGLVANEGLSFGCHLVVSNCCGVVADIEEMRGVFVCDPSTGGLARALKASRAAWTGHIETPEILERGVEHSAEAFLRAIDDVL